MINETTNMFAGEVKAGDQILLGGKWFPVYAVRRDEPSVYVHSTRNIPFHFHKDTGLTVITAKVDAAPVAATSGEPVVRSYVIKLKHHGELTKLRVTPREDRKLRTIADEVQYVHEEMRDMFGPDAELVDWYSVNYGAPDGDGDLPGPEPVDLSDISEVRQIVTGEDFSHDGGDTCEWCDGKGCGNCNDEIYYREEAAAKKDAATKQNPLLWDTPTRDFEDSPIPAKHPEPQPEPPAALAARESEATE